VPTVTETDEYDVVVLGAGPTGEVAAGRCAAGGLSVAIVEERLVGGECSYWACIPSKTLIRPGDIVAAAGRVPGVTATIDVEQVFGWRDHITSNWDDTGATRWLTDRDIALIRGHGRLAGERTVDVDGRVITVRKAVIVATGSRPRVPDIAGLDGVDYWDNRTATEAREVPRRFLVLGGGPVGCELAQAFRRLGAEEVTIVDNGPRLLIREEPFASEEVAAGLAADGIQVRTGHHVTAIGKTHATLDDGTELDFDRVLLALGRTLNTDDIGLDAVGLEPGKPIPVDHQLRVNDWLYAVGDCNGESLLTHMGKYQARQCGDVILGKTGITNQAAVTRVTFTDPQVAAVGLTEEAAHDAGLNVRVVTTPTGGVAGSSVRGRGTKGTSQMVVNTDDRVIVGATFTGPEVQELVYSAAVAIAGAVPLERLWHAVPPFPTVSEVWLRLLEAYGL
jgi:pyruvate/2-oxoglutarate dehydrogenase complex dihydrolipoamide dehydrogenase (E3) component